MLNAEANYIEAGYKCARARIQGDEASASHWRDYFGRMRALERDDDKPEVRRLFERGYSEAQPARRPEYFR